MQNPLPFPSQSHFATDFAIGVRPAPISEGWPSHPRGTGSQPSSIDRGVTGGQLTTTLYHYRVPDGSIPLYPVPVAGDRIYVARWMPGETFAGGWGYASGFSGVGALRADWLDGQGSHQSLTFASDASLSPSTDFTKFEIEAVYERNPSGQIIDLFFELSQPPLAGDVLKGRLDFVS